MLLNPDLCARCFTKLKSEKSEFEAKKCLLSEKVSIEKMGDLEVSQIHLAQYTELEVFKQQKGNGRES